MSGRRWTYLALIAVATVAGLVGAVLGTTLVDGRLAAVEASATDLEARLSDAESGVSDGTARLSKLERSVSDLGDELGAAGTTARIRLGAEHQPPGGGRFGGLQAFVETGTTEHGCVASVSETNIGNYGPFDVLCTPRTPIIDGRQRAGILIFVYRPLWDGDLGAMFPPFTIVEVTVLQPGASRYAPPVVCAIGLPDQC